MEFKIKKFNNFFLVWCDLIGELFTFTRDYTLYTVQNNHYIMNS